MKIYSCDKCGHQIYFENTLCVNCGSQLGYLPLLGNMTSLEPAGNNLWQTSAPQTQGSLFKKCQHYHKENICNWMVECDDPQDFCLSCRLNEIIPDLSIPVNRDYWHRLEKAKRRLVFSLMRLNLPLINKKENPDHGLAFIFLADTEEPENKESSKVIIGHDEGRITINIAEANDAVIEKMRLDMNEEYRTLLGHFRHEIGHYYWFLLVQTNQKLLNGFRALFGDDQEDYAEALKLYYAQGPKNNWSGQFICAYASAHPWEDWAESWAHYLHMYDALETAHAWGLMIKYKNGPELNMIQFKEMMQDFDAMKNQWGYLCAALNSMNRSMGMRDVYPFVWTDAIIEKLRFIHKVIVPFRERVK